MTISESPKNRMVPDNDVMRCDATPISVSQGLIMIHHRYHHRQGGRGVFYGTE